MPNMLQFLKRKIRPLRQCTGNPQYSFEIEPSNIDHQITHDSFRGQFSTNESDIARSSHIHKKSRNRFNFRFKRSKKNLFSSSNITGDSLVNRETSQSFTKSANTDSLSEEKLSSHQIAENVVVFDTPATSCTSNSSGSSSFNDMNSFSNEEICDWASKGSDGNSYTDEDCINDLIDNTNFVQERRVGSPFNQSMVTYNTKYANNSHILDEDGLKASATRSKVVLQQSTPFDEAESSFVSRKNKRTSAHFYGSQKFSVFKKSKTFQSQNQLMQNEIEVSSSPIFKKLNVKQNRKCRRSNTTFTMAGARKSRIIDYFNNLQMTKPIRKDPKLFRSHNEISSGLNLANAVRQPRNKVELNASNTSSTKNADGSKDEIEKIQDLFFYDESLLSNNGVENVTDDKHILSTFLDSPISVTTEESHDIVTPSVKTNESKLVQMRDMTSTGNSIEKFRRSSSMPGLNEPNLSIHVNNNSKINALKVLGDESTITPKKSLNFDQNDLLTNSIESITMSAVQSPVTFEESDDEPKPFVRGHPRNLSKNIKQMFKNVIKLQLDALSNLEKFYEAQLLKVEADRRQNLEMNPANKDKINEFFDKQLELLEERVQNNLESISKDKQKKLASTTSLKFDSPNEDMEDSIHNKTSKSFQKQLFSQKLAQIITSNQTCNNNMGLGRRSQSKNLLDLKNNLINQKNLLPSKIVSNQTNDFSPKNATFKRNLSLPFKQCKQNYRRVRNESVNEAFKLNQVSSPPELSVVGTSLKGQPLMDHEFFYQKNQSNYKSTNNSPEVKKAREVTNNLAKIVKLTKADDKKIFVISANSAFKPVKRNIQSHASASDCLANHDQAFKPIVLDVRRNSSIFYSDDSTDEKNVRKNMPMPRLSDSHLLFKIKQEKRLNDKKIMNTYQRQFQSKMSSNFTSKSNFHIETEV